MQQPATSESTQPQTVEQFLKTVLRSGVLDRQELRVALRPLPLELRSDPEAVATYLVDSGRLSRFQADKLLRGMAVGLVLGAFHVLAPIGRGGMGTVYLARDSRSQTLVALKVLPPKRAREEERVLSRFRREMEMSRRVAHPNLAWTYDVGVCQGVYYIALEYIPGKSLYRLVNDEGPLDVGRAARCFGEVASALDHAHSQGLIHRDLKPSNIIITPHDHAKVLDLGLALVRGEVIQSREVVGGRGYVVGTMDYIAPEQAADAVAVCPRSDIYSLGCSLYFALTGQPPFPGGNAKEKIQKHQFQEPTPLPQLNPNIPPGFVGIIRKMMSKDPLQRHASALDVQADLKPWSNGQPALPMDQKSDKEYQEAVAALEAAEAPEEIIEEVIPVGIVVKPKKPAPGRRPRLATPKPVAVPALSKQSSSLRYLLWAVLAFCSILTIGLTAWLLVLLF